MEVDRASRNTLAENQLGDFCFYMLSHDKLKYLWFIVNFIALGRTSKLIGIMLKPETPFFGCFLEKALFFLIYQKHTKYLTNFTFSALCLALLATNWPFQASLPNRSTLYNWFSLLSFQFSFLGKQKWKLCQTANIYWRLNAFIFPSIILLNMALVTEWS